MGTMIYQCFNQDELSPLKQELERIDYQMMPGTNEKPFNLTVFVYEMLYGTDYIDALVKSEEFNSAYALPGNDEDSNNEAIDENEEEEDDEEKKEDADEEEVDENVA